MSAHPNSYDEVPYESRAFPQTHPDRLATVARLFGLAPPAVDHCRVLELGCAGGGNLIPMAAHIPEGSFVGVDLSRREVDTAQAAINALGLRNIRVEHASILDVDADWGEFDYIICHGVYSWVEPKVQDQILQIAATQLAPQGVAYVSYNTYPGWHMRESIRHMMRYHADPFEVPAERIAQARALLDFLVASVPPDSGAYGQLLHGEVELLRRCADAYIYHEHLERTNIPLYFHQFTAQAQTHSLQYLAEADFGAMLASRFPIPIAEILERISPDILHLEQYMDFVRNRHFRQTLLCHSGHRLKRALGPRVLENLLLAAPVQVVGDACDLDSGVVMTVTGSAGTQLTSDRPATKAALAILGERWPGSVPMTQLASLALERAAPFLSGKGGTERRSLMEDLFQCVLSEAIELHSWSGTYATEVAEQPRVNALAAYQASIGPLVVNARHETVALDHLGRELVPLLDGRRNRQDLLEDLTRRIADGRLAIQSAGTPIESASQREQALAVAMDEALWSIARSALLAG